MYKHSRGFSLIELMVVVAVIGILAGIAWPSYQQHMQKAKRSAAQQFMMTIAMKQEQYLLDNRRYATGPGFLTSLGLQVPADVSANYIVSVNQLMGAEGTYTISAKPYGTMEGTDVLTLNHRGEKTPKSLWE